MNKIARKPLREYHQETHFIVKATQLFGRNTADTVDLNTIIEEATQVRFVRIGAHVKDRFCKTCKKPKYYVVTAEAPALPLKDKKLVVCTECEVIRTVYLNERSHGNTPLRPDQIARGITTAKKQCCGAIYGVAHDTQEKVDNACRHFCNRNPNKKGVNQ